MTEHRPGLHCHHETPESDCTMCTYRLLERVHDKLVHDMLTKEQELDEQTREA